MHTTAKALMITLYFSAATLGGSIATAGTEQADVAPPPARDERAPAPRDGYVWIPGYWDWRGHDYSWVSGRFVFEHRGAHWVADRWDQVASHWERVAGHWEH